MEESPYLVIGYTKTGQAFRSDRFACFQPQPDPGGVLLVQYGGRNYTLLRPADEAGDCDGVDLGLVRPTREAASSAATPTTRQPPVVLGAGGVVLALMAAGGVLGASGAAPRPATASDLTA